MNISWPVREAPLDFGVNEVHVWAVDLGSATLQAAQPRQLLSQDEQLRAQHFRIDAPRKQFIATRGALRVLLSKYIERSPAEIAFITSAAGKPRLKANANASQPITFNVAHSADMALVAIAVSAEVGVDVEHLRRIEHVERLAHRYFHADEAEQIAALQSPEQERKFLEYWTAKEAVLKSIGSGITSLLEGMPAMGDATQPTAVRLKPHITNQFQVIWFQRVSPATDYAAAVACTGEMQSVRCFQFVSPL
jgi:4'-phosphopantetheinyl transferase